MTPLTRQAVLRKNHFIPLTLALSQPEERKLSEPTHLECRCPSQPCAPRWDAQWESPAAVAPFLLFLPFAF
jgi:hypothetical protein